MRYRRLTARFVRLEAVRPSDPLTDLLHGVVPVIGVAPPRWRPAADVCETASAVKVVVDLPGIDEDAIDILLYADALVVEGTRESDTCEPDGFYHAAEIRQGPFRIEVVLPSPVDEGHVEASYDRGLLRIDLAKSINPLRSRD